MAEAPPGVTRKRAPPPPGISSKSPTLTTEGSPTSISAPIRRAPAPPPPQPLESHMRLNELAVASVNDDRLFGNSTTYPTTSAGDKQSNGYLQPLLAGERTSYPRPEKQTKNPLSPKEAFTQALAGGDGTAPATTPKKLEAVHEEVKQVTNYYNPFDHISEENPLPPASIPIASSHPERMKGVESLQPKVAPPPPPPKRSISGELAIKLVVWDFDGTSTSGGLTVRAGDKVNVVSSDALWCVVSYGKRSGLVPKSYLSDPPPVDIEQEERASERVPSRPLLLDYGKESGFARDLIAIRSRDGTSGTVTKPVVRFYGASGRKECVGERIQMFVDGRPRCELRLGTDGMVMEANGLYEWNLKSLAPDAVLDKSVHTLHVRYEHVVAGVIPPVRFAECLLFVWNFDDVVVVSDVDGTITRSDVKGHLNTTLLIKAGYAPNSYAHPGVCALFSHLAKECFPCRFVYLTARPLDLCVETRTYLRGLKQDGKVLPLGPCITDATTYYGSLKREVIEKTSHLFKAKFLTEDLMRCFDLAGRDIVERPVFMAGFGNKETDGAAYRMAGVHPVLTFIIDSRSVLSAGAGYAAKLSSYDDPNLLSWLSDMTKLFRNGKLPPVPTAVPTTIGPQ